MATQVREDFVGPRSATLSPVATSQSDNVDPAAANWDQVKLSADKATAAAKPKLYYYSQIYRYRYGIGQLKGQTDVLRKHLPNAGIGANFSPHHKTLYLGDTSQWISTFREDGLTMPWGEDYIWQVPVGTQQMNFLSRDWDGKGGETVRLSDIIESAYNDANTFYPGKKKPGLVLDREHIPWNVTGDTSVPRRMRDVSRASAPSVIQASVGPGRPSPVKSR